MPRIDKGECDYLGCEKESEILSHEYIGPFHLRTQWCKKHHEEFRNFIKVIEAKNVMWRPGQ